MAKLILHQGDGSMRDIKLDHGRITIGRRADNDICLPYPPVSGDHAVVITVMADSFLHDLGSTNGTLVNGTRITKHFLRNGDRIDIARQQLVYLTNDAETVDPLPVAIASTEGAASESDDESAKILDHGAPTVSEIRATQQREIAPTERCGEQLAPVDALLSDLMEMQSNSSAAVDMSPMVAVVPSRADPVIAAPATNGGALASDGAVLEILTGPHAGRITPMTKPEFVLGKAGASVAAIRRDREGYRLHLLARGAGASLNGTPVAPDGAKLAFGDTIDVAGVKLRFSRAQAV